VTHRRSVVGLPWMLAVALVGCSRGGLATAAADASPAPAPGADAATAPVSPVAAVPVPVPAHWQVCATFEAAGDARPHHQGPVTALAGSADGRLLASYSVDDAYDPNRQVWIWRVQEGALWKRITMKEDGAGQWLDLSPDGTLLGAAGDGRGVYRVADGLEPYDLASPDIDSDVPGLLASSIRFSPDGSMVAVGGWGRHAYVFRATDGQLLGSYRSAVPAPGVAISPDGTILATSVPELVRLREGASAAGPPSSPSIGGGKYIEHVAVFSPDGHRLLVSNCGGSGRVCTASTRLLNGADGSLVADLGGTLGGRPAFSRDGAWVVGGA
jgi:WD40 repeat protein